MTIAFTRDASIDLDANPAGETATFTFSSPTDVKVRYTLRDVDGKPYTVKDIDFLAFTSTLTPEQRSTLLEELRAFAADDAGFTAVP